MKLKPGSRCLAMAGGRARYVVGRDGTTACQQSVRFHHALGKDCKSNRHVRYLDAAWSCGMGRGTNRHAGLIAAVELGLCELQVVSVDWIFFNIQLRFL